jgi:hypothetical protein
VPNNLKFGRDFFGGELMKDLLSGLLVGVGAVALVAVLNFLMGWVVALLWNWLMPAIFGLTTITYLQGVGLMFLSGMLFKSSNTSKSKS